ncbi:hypothetical protein C8J57DRAFT_175599 [Mycena rebaudengoi]|nr:hypothetical protein C8J57DRAFT_175599 [Mycena rebaudengoi]
MASSLPPEILNAIVHEVDDAASLRRCSLVSTTFLHPSQQCLFRSLHLHPDDIQPAHTLFQSSPHLAIYVRDVKFDLEESWTQNLNYVLVPFLLDMLSNIVSLRVRGTSANFSLANVPPLTSALCHALALPSLERFELANISDMPPSLLLTAVSSVTHLKIVDLSSRVPNAIGKHEKNVYRAGGRTSYAETRRTHSHGLRPPIFVAYRRYDNSSRIFGCFAEFKNGIPLRKSDSIPSCNPHGLSHARAS